ncbi:MAG: hypothetical protein IPJ65_13765 [Archangiaceae bacterium]|nr:hypothetical protein [Archangiaceae bacterium]
MRPRASAVANLLLLLAATLPLSALAFDQVPVPKLRAFLSKKNPCHVWVVGWRGEQLASGTTYGDVFCILDGVIGEGTLDEQTGCMVAKYDPSTDRYEMDPLGMGAFILEAPCSAQLVARLPENIVVANLLRATTFVESQRILVGGVKASAAAFARGLCRAASGPHNCDGFVADVTDTAPSAAPAKDGKGVKKASEDEKTPVPPWLKKR